MHINWIVAIVIVLVLVIAIVLIMQGQSKNDSDIVNGSTFPTTGNIRLTNISTNSVTFQIFDTLGNLITSTVDNIPPNGSMVFPTVPSCQSYTIGTTASSNKIIMANINGKTQYFYYNISIINYTPFATVTTTNSNVVSFQSTKLPVSSVTTSKSYTTWSDPPTTNLITTTSDFPKTIYIYNNSKERTNIVTVVPGKTTDIMNNFVNIIPDQYSSSIDIPSQSSEGYVLILNNILPNLFNGCILYNNKGTVNKVLIGITDLPIYSKNSDILNESTFPTTNNIRITNDTTVAFTNAQIYDTKGNITTASGNSILIPKGTTTFQTTPTSQSYVLRTYYSDTAGTKTLTLNIMANINNKVKYFYVKIDRSTPKRTYTITTSSISVYSLFRFESTKLPVSSGTTPISYKPGTTPPTTNLITTGLNFPATIKIYNNTDKSSIKIVTFTPGTTDKEFTSVVSVTMNTYSTPISIPTQPQGQDRYILILYFDNDIYPPDNDLNGCILYNKAGTDTVYKVLIGVVDLPIYSV